MISNMKKQLWSLARLVLPCVGLALACIGVYVAYLQTEYEYTLKVIPAYLMIVFGVLAVLIGVFWSICHSMKSKMYQRGEHEQHISVYTIERPSSFPPSYEESQGSQESPDSAPPEFVVVVDGVDVAMSLAPPLYSRDSLDAPDCTWSWEQPPRYSQVERIGQEEVIAEKRTEAFVQTLNGGNIFA